MDMRYDLFVIFGFVIFGVGAVARAFMNRQIQKHLPERSIWSSTEKGYRQLVRENRGEEHPDDRALFGNARVAVRR